MLPVPGVKFPSMSTRRAAPLAKKPQGSPPDTKRSQKATKQKNYTAPKSEIIGGGGFGTVIRATKKDDGSIFALKVIKFSPTDLREESFKRESESLNRLKGHPNIVDILWHRRTLTKGRIAMELLPATMGAFIAQARDDDQFSSVLQSYVYQLMLGLAHCHENGYVHGDIKPHNILLSPDTGLLKIADFGGAMLLGSNHRIIPGQMPFETSTGYIAPEMLMQGSDNAAPENFTYAVDMWSAGCVLAETMIGTPLFATKGQREQLEDMYTILGPPSAKEWPKVRSLKLYDEKLSGLPGLDLKAVLGTIDDEFVSLVKSLLTYNPATRMTAKEALKHPYLIKAPIPRH